MLELFGADLERYLAIREKHREHIAARVSVVKTTFKKEPPVGPYGIEFGILISPSSGRADGGEPLSLREIADAMNHKCSLCGEPVIDFRRRICSVCLPSVRLERAEARRLYARMRWAIDPEYRRKQLEDNRRYIDRKRLANPAWWERRMALQRARYLWRRAVRFAEIAAKLLGAKTDAA